MSLISIKVQIAERVYPLKINKEEESYIRDAAKNINKHIQNLQQNYQVRDTQDLLSMSLIYYANCALKLEKQLENSYKQTSSFLEEFNNSISKTINTTAK